MIRGPQRERKKAPCAQHCHHPCGLSLHPSTALRPPGSVTAIVGARPQGHAAQRARGLPSLRCGVRSAGLVQALACGGLAADGDRPDAVAEARHLRAVRAGGSHRCAPSPGPHVGPPGARGRRPSVCRCPHGCGPLHAPPCWKWHCWAPSPPCPSPAKHRRPRRIRCMCARASEGPQSFCAPARSS
jgi:hypothetical protein